VFHSNILGVCGNLARIYDYIHRPTYDKTNYLVQFKFS
jgi:hypothetical protein